MTSEPDPAARAREVLPYASFPTTSLLAVRVCPDCGALVFDQDEAETVHRQFHLQAGSAW